MDTCHARMWVYIGYVLISLDFCDDFQLASVLNSSTIFVPIVTGTTLNYFLDDKINKAEILFPGVGCFLIAVFLGSAVHSSNAADNKAKLSNFTGDYKDGDMYVLFAYYSYIEIWVLGIGVNLRLMPLTDFPIIVFNLLLTLYAFFHSLFSREGYGLPCLGSIWKQNQENAFGNSNNYYIN